MAIGTLGAALRDLADLFHDGTTVGLSDAQLLARYATSNDGSAFAALVARHGPMVLSTCRAILRHEHDVEDAFQATFLVLARKASSVRAGDALGGWLHRVAYRVAMAASAAAKQRHRRESGAWAMAMTIPSRIDSGLEPDVCAIVHEEIDRLPDRHRLPVVLCDLEGLTYDQAAARLAWTVPALRCQLSKARRRLRERLTHRGVTGAALGAVIASSEATAAVPAAWVATAVTAATGGASSMAAAALSQAIIRGMLMTKLKIAVAAALVAIGIASAGVNVLGVGWLDEPKPALNAPTAAQKPTAAARKEVTATGALIEVHGRVVDPDGKLVPGAVVRSFQPVPYDRPAPEATSGPDGRFFLRVPPWRRLAAVRQPRLPHVPLGRCLCPRVRARLGLGVPGARRLWRLDNPAGGGGSANRGPRRRPGGTTGRRRPRQGRAHRGSPGYRPGNLARPGPGARRRKPLAGFLPVTGDDDRHHRSRRSIPPDRARPRPARRPDHLRAEQSPRPSSM